MSDGWARRCVMVVVEVEAGEHEQERAVERVHRALSGQDRPWRMWVSAQKRLERQLKRKAVKRAGTTA